MGMFDEVKCKMPLPLEIDVEHRDHWFQTKSLDCMLEYYEIREDGTLWKRNYNKTDSWDRVPADPEWIRQVEFTGEIAFYTQASSVGAKNVGQSHSGWIEFSTYFVRGELKQFELIRYDMPSSC